MSSSINLLTVPPEIRAIIWTFLFDTPRLIHIRCPSRCRLRQARVDKDDPSGILYVCRLLRQEAVPPFFAVNTLRFRHTSEILEFLQDPQLDPLSKYNINRIAADDGDVMDLQALKHAQVNAILTIFGTMPSLRTLEFRAWARTDNAHYLTNLNKLHEFWISMKKARDAGPEAGSTEYCDFVVEDPMYGLATNTMQNAGVNVTVHDTKEKYSTGNLSRLTQPDNVHLHVCNLLLSKNANEKRNLDCAKNAVVQRMKVAGATHIKDDNVLERLTWGVDDFPWLSNQRGLGERYH